MAKKNGKDEQLNYKAEIRLMKERGPERLYLLWGPEDYLREQYLLALKAFCLPEGEDGFSFRRLNGPELDALTLREAVDAMPFMTERTFVEVREANLNRLKEPDAILDVLRDVPETCTVALVQNASFEPDGRVKLIKGLRALARELKFTKAGQTALIEWIKRRYAALGKTADLEAIQRLILISGDLMNRLIPEIEKTAAYAKGEKVTVADINAVANHIPEADIFEMTDFIAQKKMDSAVSLLAELLADKNNEPIPVLAMLGTQMRRLYAARLAIEKELGAKYVMEACAIKYDFVATKLLRAARGFTLAQLKRAVELCAEADYKIKSSSLDDRELLVETVLRIAAGEEHA